MKFDKKEIFTIPNILTYFRLLCVPFFMWLMLDKSIAYNAVWALAVFVVAEITDLVDGAIARKFNMGSDIGKIVDPIADKLLQSMAVLCLTIIGRVHWIFTVIIIVKELYMTFGSIIVLKLVGSKVNIQANVWGKVAGALFTAGIVLAFLVEIVEVSFALDAKKFFYIDWVVLGIACAVAIWAAVQYTMVIINQVKLTRSESNNVADEIDESEKQD